VWKSYGTSDTAERAEYRGHIRKWDTIIEKKTLELTLFLSGRSANLKLGEPTPILERLDTRTLRAKILKMTQSEATKLGIGRGALHYLRKNASGQCSFRMYRRTLRRLESAPSAEGQTSGNRG